MDQHLLSIVLLTPLAGLAVLLLIPGKSKGLIRIWANLVGLAGFLVSLPLVQRFSTDIGGFQFEEKVDWIPTLGAHYHLGMDGISLLLVMLTTLMGFLAILSSWNVDPGPGEGILRHVPAVADGHDRRVHLARFLPVLHLLGTGAGPHVLHHRGVGRAAEAVRRDQVLPVHAGRIGADAVGHSDALLPALSAIRRSTRSKSRTS